METETGDHGGGLAAAVIFTDGEEAHGPAAELFPSEGKSTVVSEIWPGDQKP